MFLTMNSFKISFWIVPERAGNGAPCSSAATMYMAIMGRTAPFIVIETDILSKGIPSKRIYANGQIDDGMGG